MVFCRRIQGDSQCCGSLTDLPLLSDKSDASDNPPWLTHRGTSTPLCQTSSYTPPPTAAGSTFYSSKLPWNAVNASTLMSSRQFNALSSCYLVKHVKAHLLCRYLPHPHWCEKTRTTVLLVSYELDHAFALRAFHNLTDRENMVLHHFHTASLG